MRTVVLALAFLLQGVPGANAQWQMQDSHTTAALRGIHSVNGQIAWASGANGTVLRTIDGGQHWGKCAAPPDADKLDFRAVWAWNDKEAMVMSAGPGELSRVYKTVDGCAHWTQELKNTDKDGFWDAMVFRAGESGSVGDVRTGLLIGDPVRGRFETKLMMPGKDWRDHDAACVAKPGEAAFAASNSSAFLFGSRRYILGTGGKGGPHVLISPLLAFADSTKPCRAVDVPIAGGNDSSGIFSLFFRDAKHGVAVGGDYKQPAQSTGTAAWTDDGGLHWTAASKLPHGYRSAVAWDPQTKLWIAAGTNGSDISRDGGKTWQPLDDANWNALSLPFVVGPEGRIARLGTVSKH